MNWCRIAGNSNLRCFVNIRVLIAVLHFSSLYPGAFVSKAVERKDTFLLSQLVCLDRFSGIKAFLCYFLFIFIKRNTREEKQCIIKAPTTTQIEITWPYNQIKKFHNEGILIVLPYIIAASKDSEVVFHCRITCCFSCRILFIQIRQGKSPLVPLISGILKLFSVFHFSTSHYVNVLLLHIRETPHLFFHSIVTPGLRNTKAPTTWKVFKM